MTVRGTHRGRCMMAPGKRMPMPVPARRRMQSALAAGARSAKRAGRTRATMSFRSSTTTVPWRWAAVRPWRRMRRVRGSRRGAARGPSAVYRDTGRCGAAAVRHRDALAELLAQLDGHAAAPSVARDVWTVVAVPMLCGLAAYAVGDTDAAAAGATARGQLHRRRRGRSSSSAAAPVPFA